MSDKGITLEGLAAAVDALRQELATWKALAHKQDQLSADQITATQSGATAAKISQIAVNTAAIQSLAAQVAGQISLAYVTTLPATGEPLTLYLVPQGDGTAPNYCNEYLWVNGAWELIGTTGAMANNGELTIQVNGAAVGTFTANQSANASINIAVPTNTNQLINGAQYVDASALATALALKQNNLNASQLEAVNSGITAALVTQIGTNTTAIAGKQDALTGAQQAAVDSGATAAKIDQIASNASAIVALTSSKQDTLSTAQLAAVNSGITSAAVQQISTNTGAIATKAADSAVVHLAGTETISGDKTFTGAVATHNVTPETDGTYSLGSSSYQWASVYAQTYYYNGTAWGLDKANTWTGNNIFSKSTAPASVTSVTDTTLAFNGLFNTIFLNTRGSANRRSYGSFLFVGYGSASGADNYGQIQLLRSTDKRGDTNEGYVPDTSFKMWRVAPHSLLMDFMEVVRVTNDGTENSLKPITASVTDLGTSDNKWKTLNGINPGALSLPNQNSTDRLALDTTGWVLDGSVANAFTPSFSGWLNIRIPDTAGNYVLMQSGGAGTIVVSNQGTGVLPSSVTRPLGTLIPVTAGVSGSVRVKAESIVGFFYPCLGNV